MERAELEASWGRTRAHLLRAHEAFNRRTGSADGTAEALDFLDHNELELCAEVLAEVGEDLEAPAFWAALAAAAYEMRLTDRALRWIARTRRFPCPCCGHLVFEEHPGSYEICPLCFWEDDAVQLRWPEYDGGANRPGLVAAQAKYAETGAMEHRFTGIVRGASADEPVEPGWRPADPSRDNFESWGQPSDAWPGDSTNLYWWRPTYWRRSPEGRTSAEGA